jgi:hypothetical protein
MITKTTLCRPHLVRKWAGDLSTGSAIQPGTKPEACYYCQIEPFPAESKFRLWDRVKITGTRSFQGLHGYLFGYNCSGGRLLVWLDKPHTYDDGSPRGRTAVWTEVHEKDLVKEKT